MSWAVPLTDVAMTDADIEAVLDCLRGGWLTMGPRTQQFEQAFAELLGVPHAVAVSSGTAALHLALLAAGIGPGDEVLVPCLTFVAAAAAVRYCGAMPVMVDSVGPDDLNLDPSDAARLISPHTKAVLATHWLGYACDLPALQDLCAEHGLVLIEDCAQSITAMDRADRVTGTVGAAGCFSMFSKKQLCVGEGGMVVTADDQLAAQVSSLRSHTMTTVTWDRHRGHADSYDITGVGFNYRIDEPRAALGLSRLSRLGREIDNRRALARHYRRTLQGLDRVRVPWSDEDVERSSHFGFAVLLETPQERARVAEALEAHGIQTTSYRALTLLSEYRDHPGCPRAEWLSERHLVLPLASNYTTERLDQVTFELEAAVTTAA
jgi:dTDP-4-amino-4,6-dideoxygalactose transaminase